jgi:Mg2+ and Co2+ transporter CorA
LAEQEPGADTKPEAEALIDAYWFDGQGSAERVAWEGLTENTYILSVIAAIFLPLSLLTGLLGINVGGIPGEKWQWSFTAVTVAIFVLGLIEYWLLKKLKWI